MTAPESVVGNGYKRGLWLMPADPLAHSLTPRAIQTHDHKRSWACPGIPLEQLAV
jgi:hypothetical protein